MNNKNKACIEKLLKCIGVDKLKKIEYENNGYIWNEDLFYRLKAEFSEINDYLRYKSEILKKHGLIKKRECIEMGRLKRKMKLIYDVSDKNGDQLKIVLLEVASKHNADRLQILFF